MATGPGVNQGKGKFLREFLPGNTDASVEAVTAAWAAEGHDDGISESLISKIRSELGLTGKKRAGGGATETVASKAAKGKAKPSPKGASGKPTSKKEKAPSQPADRDLNTEPSRSAFVEGVLAREPGANLKKVNESWASAGFEGQISPSIYYKVKRERGLTGEHTLVDTASPAPSHPEASEAGFSIVVIEEAPQFIGTMESSSVTASGDLERLVDQVEAGIDDLIFILKVNGGMPEVEAALRAARRLLVRSNGA